MNLRTNKQISQEQVKEIKRRKWRSSTKLKKSLKLWVTIEVDLENNVNPIPFSSGQAQLSTQKKKKW